MATTSARTILGSLTTPFTYPSSCTAVHLNCATCTYGWQAQACSTNTFNSQGLQDDPSCWPPRSDAGLSTGVAFGGWGFYSPGLSCPTGYTTACRATGNSAGGFTFQFPLLSSETAVGCCPSGYACRYTSGSAQTCYNIISTGAFPTVSCSSQNSVDSALLTIPATVTATTTATDSASLTAATTIVLSTITALAPLIQINWQSSDIPAPSSTASSSTPSSTTLTSTMPSSSGSGNNRSSGGLGTGGSIGLGVGIGVAVVLLLCALAWFLVWKRRQRAAAQAEPAPALNQPSKTGDVPYQAVAYQNSPHDGVFYQNVPQQDGVYHEMPVQGVSNQQGAHFAELSAARETAELPAGRYN